MSRLDEYDDLEVDGEVSSDSSAARRIHRCPYSKEKSHCQDRIDSGICSMTFSSSDSAISEIRKQISDIHRREGGCTEACTDNNVVCDSVDNVANKLKDTVLESDDDEGISSFDPDNVFVKKCTKVTDRITDEALEVYGRDVDGDTLLHISIIHGNDKVTREFIRLAPWNNWLDIYNEKLRQTPLHLTALLKNAVIARALLVGGADPEFCDHNGDTPLHIACRKGHVAVVGALMKPVTSTETAHVEYEYSQKRIPQNLELRNSDGFTCLHLAAENGHRDILQTLVSQGADVNAGDGKSGYTVLHIAARKNDIQLAKHLIRCRRLKVDKESYNGTTPLMLAVARRNDGMVQLLLGAGAQMRELNDFDDNWSDEE